MALDINARINNVFPYLSKGHKKIANFILNNYDKAAFITASALGKLVGVSESTVVRFASELGFEGYSELQKAIEELVRSKLTSNQRIDITNQRFSKGDVIESVMEEDIANIRSTLEKMDKKVFYSAVDALLSARTVYIMGVRSTEPLARILAYNLSMIFDNVKFVNPTSTSEVFEQMLNINEGDTIVAFSFPRYSSKMVNAVKFASDKGAKVIVITDSENSPLVKYSGYFLCAQSDMASFMDSLIAPLSIINAIVVEITKRRERDIRARFEKLEKIWDQYDVYTK